jgi:hypothetical protein
VGYTGTLGITRLRVLPLDTIGCRCGDFFLKPSHRPCLPTAWISGESTSPAREINAVTVLVLTLLFCILNIATMIPMIYHEKCEFSL